MAELTPAKHAFLLIRADSLALLAAAKILAGLPRSGLCRPIAEALTVKNKKARRKRRKEEERADENRIAEKIYVFRNKILKLSQNDG